MNIWNSGKNIYMKALFDAVSIGCSRLTTKAYSTSFSLGILCLQKELRDPIYSVYGFVRFADEIVDTFHDYDKALLFERFHRDTLEAIADRISLNPILNSFQATVHAYQIPRALIDRFLNSMEMDLYRTQHDEETFREYINGSAEVVGLMCLRVFCKGNGALYEHLKEYAMSLGSAFQKVNFLRDLKNDYTVLGRVYFPDIQINRFSENNKRQIEKSLEADFADGFQGIKQLPRSSRLGVYVAFVYYLALFRKIKNTPSERVLKSRITIPNTQKATLLAFSFVKYRLNMM